MTDDGPVLLTRTREIVTFENGTSKDPIRRDEALAIDGGEVAACGPEAELLERFPGCRTIDCAGGVITPGFVDSHTHAVFGAWRAAEYELRSRGTPYMEIARQGGGIHSSVRDLRARSEDDLIARSLPRLERMLRLGTTTAEVKSGYGLELDAELRTLRAIGRLDGLQPIDLVPTFLGGHEVPPGYPGGMEGYAEHVAEVMVPAVAAADLARFCDVFMEPGVFDGAATERILRAGSAHGLMPRLHADELENSGAAELAASLHAASADHLGAISDAGIDALAGSETVATLLPATLLFLGRTRFAPARRLLEAGAHVGLATDFNPGSAPSPSMPLVLTLACSQMGMTPIEALHAATAGGARALRLNDGRGTLREGAPADLIVWDVEDHREIPYRFGWPPIAAVWKGGRPVAGRL